MGTRSRETGEFDLIQLSRTPAILVRADRNGEAAYGSGLFDFDMPVTKRHQRVTGYSVFAENLIHDASLAEVAVIRAAWSVKPRPEKARQLEQFCLGSDKSELGTGRQM